MNRRQFVLIGPAGAALSGLALPSLGMAQTPRASAPKPFELDEATIASLTAGLQSGKWTARSLAEKYLARIDAIDRKGPTLRSVIEINPAALRIADALDRERKEKGPEFLAGHSL